MRKRLIWLILEVAQVNCIIIFILAVCEIVIPCFAKYYFCSGRICLVSFVEGTGAIFVQSFVEQGDTFLGQIQTKTLRMNLISFISEVI